MVKIYSLSRMVLKRGPTISMAILSKPVPGVSDSVVGFSYSSIFSYSYSSAIHFLHYFFTFVSRWVTNYIMANYDFGQTPQERQV